MTQAYPLGLRLTGRRVVVVGGGRVAERRVGALLAAGADVLLVAPAVTDALAALAAAGRLRHEPRRWAGTDLDGAWLVHAATDDPVVNAAVTASADARQIYTVRADDAAGSAAWTPAVGRYDGLTVAVFGGGDPRRAAALRDRVLDDLVTGGLTAPRQRDPDLDGVLRPGVAIVGGGPGDPGLITVRGRRLLARADVVVVDRLAPHLLDELDPDVLVVDAAKVPYSHGMSQQAINEALVTHARAGRFVVRLKGGDPFLFGRGGEEVEACAAAGVPVTVVPGVSSAFAVPAAVGVPVTHRGVAHEVVVVSGHVPPGDPRSLVDWAALGRLRGTLVLLMAVERLDAITRALLTHGRPAATPAVAVADGTTPAQRAVSGTLATIAADVREAGLGPPAVVVIGEVAAAAPLPR